jgi:hypothetical protein
LRLIRDGGPYAIAADKGTTRSGCCYYTTARCPADAPYRCGQATATDTVAGAVHAAAASAAHNTAAFVKLIARQARERDEYNDG